MEILEVLQVSQDFKSAKNRPLYKVHAFFLLKYVTRNRTKILLWFENNYTHKDVVHVKNCENSAKNSDSECEGNSFTLFMH